MKVYAIAYQLQVISTLLQKNYKEFDFVYNTLF